MKYLGVKGALCVQFTLKWLRKNKTDVVMLLFGGLSVKGIQEFFILLL